MKILIDFIQIPLQKIGVGIYAFNLVHEIYKIDKNNAYFFIIQNDDDFLDFIQNDRFKVLKVNSKFFRNPFLMAILEQVYIPYLVLKYKIDIVHSLHHSFPIFANAKKVVTIHDLTFFKYPQYHRPSRKYLFRVFDYLASVFADKIITDSKSSLNDFLQLFGKSGAKSCVIYLGKSDLFRPNLDVEKIEEIKTKYKIGEKYLLFIGTIEPRKNIKNLILAFHRLLQENSTYKLVITGKKGWWCQEVLRLPQELGLSENIIFTGFIDEKDKPYLISGAKIFIYPSIYEGFGIPVLEALSCGVPTITSNISSMPEVAGDAALLINPLDVEELYLGIKRLLDDKVLYTQLKQRSIKQADKFSWEKSAGETIDIYNAL